VELYAGLTGRPKRDNKEIAIIFYKVMSHVKPDYLLPAERKKWRPRKKARCCVALHSSPAFAGAGLFAAYVKKYASLLMFWKRNHKPKGRIGANK